MLNRARSLLPKTRSGRQCGRLHIIEADLRLNLSFVLHERSDSAAVRDTIRHVTDHAAHANRLTRPSHLALLADRQRAGATPAPELVLGATIGLPHLLPDALGRMGWSGVPIHLLDEAGSTVPAPFFRAAAHLKLPDETTTIVVAALVLRPGNRSAHLRVSETMRWPEDHAEALRALERLIQSYANQWMPPRALWEAPAELLMSGEIQ